MMLNVLVSWCVVVCAFAQDTAPGDNIGPTSATNGPTSGPGDSNGDQTPPVWLKCMADVSGQDVSSANIKSVFETWCSNYESIVQCLTSDLPSMAESNPFDFFISLHFDPDRLRESSRNFCGALKASSGQLTCSANQNKTLATLCGHAFTRGLFHVYGLFKEKNAPNDALAQIACDVTTQTTFCLRQSLPECTPEIQSTLLNYYALFTNDSCVAAQDYEPPRPQPQRPNTIVAKCADEAQQTLTADQNKVQPTSVIDFVVLELKSDCKTYPARFQCYDRELRNVTNFLDFWLSLTFDLGNAISSQKSYCQKIEDLVIPSLNTECFNMSHPALLACEEGFAQEVETIRREWVENPDLDGLQLQRLACRTSVTRAKCLGDAMKHCGEDVAQAMAISEMGILPDVCRQLLLSNKDERPYTGSDDMGETGNGDGNVRPMNGRDDHHHPMNGGAENTKDNEIHHSDMGYHGNNNDNGNTMMNDGKMGTDGKIEPNSASVGNINDNNKSSDGDGGDGVSMVYANYYVTALLFSTVFAFTML